MGKDDGSEGIPSSRRNTSKLTRTTNLPNLHKLREEKLSKSEEVVDEEIVKKFDMERRQKNSSISFEL
jgi:hypothetical protein